MCYPFWAIEDPITRSQERVNLNGETRRVSPFVTGVIGFSAYQYAHFRITSDNLLVVGTHSRETPFEPVLIVLPRIPLDSKWLASTLTKRSREKAKNKQSMILAPNFLISLPSIFFLLQALPSRSTYIKQNRGIKRNFENWFEGFSLSLSLSLSYDETYERGKFHSKSMESRMDRR